MASALLDLGLSAADGGSPGLLNNLTATTAPGVGDDSADGYSAGSLWFNTATAIEYVCTNASVGAATWTAVKSVNDKLNNLTATTAPTTGDDSADGYSAGSIWFNTITGFAYICTSASVGAAAWEGVNGTNATPVFPHQHYVGGKAWGVANNALVAGYMYALPLVVPKTAYYDRATVYFTGGNAAYRTKMSFYANVEATLTPGAKLAESTTEAVGSTGYGHHDFTPILLERGQIIWPTIVSNNIPTIVHWTAGVIGAGGPFAALAVPLGASTLQLFQTNQVSRYISSSTITHTTGASPFMPSSWPAGSFTTGTPGAPVTLLRVYAP